MRLLATALVLCVCSAALAEDDIFRGGVGGAPVHGEALARPEGAAYLLDRCGVAAQRLFAGAGPVFDDRQH